MKTRRIINLLAAALLAPATLALGQVGVRQDQSDFLVWTFLGFCALIVVVQLAPVVILAFGMIKGLITGKNPQAETESVTEK